MLFGQRQLEHKWLACNYMYLCSDIRVCACVRVCMCVRARVCLYTCIREQHVDTSNNQYLICDYLIDRTHRLEYAQLFFT